MLDYIAIINDGVWALVLPLVPANTATINGADRIASFRRELYRVISDDPTVGLEYVSGNLQNPYKTFGTVASMQTIDLVLRGQVNFNLVVRTLKAGTDVFTDVAKIFHKALWSAYPGLGLSITGLKVVDFRFNLSNYKTGRDGKKTIYKMPIMFDVRAQKSVLAAV